MRNLLFYFSLLLLGMACTASQKAMSSATTSSTVTASPEVNTSLDSLAWTTDLETAQKIAKKNNLQVLMIFSGSDWCRPCQAFKQEVLQDEAFRNSAKDQVVVLYLDFPTKKRNQLSPKETAHNAALAERYNKTGVFPTVLLMPTEGNSSPCELKYKGQSSADWIKKIPAAIENCDS